MCSIHMNENFFSKKKTWGSEERHHVWKDRLRTVAKSKSETIKNEVEENERKYKRACERQGKRN